MKKWFTDKGYYAGSKEYLIFRKITMLIVFIFVIYGNMNAQLLDKKITVKLTNVSFQDALKEIENAAKVRFVYSEDQLNIKDKVSVDVNDKTLKETLDTFLKPYNISYRIHENELSITLRRHVQKSRSILDPGINNLTDDSQIEGKVTASKTQEGLAGANIIVKGSINGTTTDSDGMYRIFARPGDVLIFSFIGFTQSEVVINNQTLIDVSLVEDVKSLDEVVINAGYYQIDSKDQTGNISRITSKEIATQPVINPLQALQGRMAGVHVSQLTGIPGDGFSIQIRGVNSIRGSAANEPLYIIDGVPFSSTTLFAVGGSITKGPSPLNSINPSDIESIEVLKDADATAIYGSRGANGVVLITTKKGKGGKTQADINVYTGIGTMGNQMSLLNTSNYLQMRREAFRNDGVAPTIANAPDLLLWDTTRYTDWRKTLLGGSAHITNAQATISGGNSNTQFLVGAGFFRQTTVFPGDYNYQKGSVHFNLSHTTENGKFSANVSNSIVIDNNNLPSVDFTSLMFNLAPNSPSVYDATGNLNWENGTWSNPYGDMKRRYTTSSKNLITNANLSYQLLPGLKLKGNLGYNTITSDEKNIVPIAAQNPANNPLGSTISTRGSITTWIAEPQLDYERSIGKGKLNMLLGGTFQQTVRDRQGFFAFGYINDTQLENLAAASSLNTFGIDYSEYKYNAIFGRVNYNWDGKYLVNITGRRDGSSRFGPNKRFANFGAIGAAWIFSNELFVKNFIPGLSFGKLRTSYGVTGSDQIGDYQYLDTYSPTTGNYQGGKGLIPNRLLNPDFGWEENQKLEAGIELGFFNDRLFISASYYHNRSSNQLVGYSLPATTGFSSIQSNLPATIQNTGLEIVVSNVTIRRKSFTWSSSINLTIPRNRLISYPNIEGSPYANTYTVDKSLFIQKKYRSLGVNSQTGLYTFEDVDNNGSLSSTIDTQFIKEKAIDFFGGIQNSFSWQRFELQFLFQFVKQTGQNYLSTLINAPGTLANQPTLVLNRWQRIGDITDIQKFSQSNSGIIAYGTASVFGDAVISDASYVRLQNVSFSYSLPLSISDKIRSEKIRLYCQGQNLFMFTDFAGADPETQNAVVLSPLRLLTFGAQITF